jgi:hypothetical protein
MPKLKPSDQVTSLRKLQADLMEKLKEAQTKAKLEAKEIQRIKNEIAGSIALKELDANPSGSFASAFLELLNTGVTKASQRAMFDLPPLLKAANDEPDTVPDSAAENGAIEPTPAPESTPEKTPRHQHPNLEAGRTNYVRALTALGRSEAEIEAALRSVL